ncbi:hypothetical protein SLEP1_g18594 [Rubroshorea leprosula]|uniref:Uncharacterized protein n=1 Tax=Rubroshorea leprosula TaxID=152421 RepID=A0AAV5J3W1_9ROSI|nr:hypothetical protein SLEP1_g18594 [Rubroshorea leprosula]
MTLSAPKFQTDRQTICTSKDLILPVCWSSSAFDSGL